MKRITILIVCFCMTFGLLCGCTQSSGSSPSPSPSPSAPAATDKSTPAPSAEAATPSEDKYFNVTGFPITNEPITLSFFLPTGTEHAADYSDSWFVKEIEKKTNITLDVIQIPWEGFNERKNLAFASGDYPDIMTVGLNKGDVMLYGPQGLLLPLQDLIEDYAPRIKEIFETEALSTYKKLVTTPDGNIYRLPTVIVSAENYAKLFFYNVIWFNKKWVDNLGLEMPSTLDDLYNVLKAFKEDDPDQNGQDDTIPLSVTYKGDWGVESIIIGALGYVSRRHDVVDGEYVFVPMQPEYKEYYKYMNKLFSEGLLDNEYFTQDSAQLRAKVTEVKVGLTDLDLSFIVQDYQDYVILPALTSHINQTPMMLERPIENDSNGCFAITNKCEYPEAAIRLADYIFTGEGSTMMRAGPEKGKYEELGEGGWEIVTEDGRTFGRASYPGFDNYYNWRGQHIPLNSFPFTNAFENVDFYVGVTDPRNMYQTDSVTKAGWVDVKRYMYPPLYFTIEESERLSLLETDINTYLNEMEARFISGDTDIDAGWDRYIQTLKDMHIDEVIEIRQKAYDRF